MKKNIAIIGLDRTTTRLTASMVAEELGLRFFDMRDLFVFDHKPHTFKEMLTTYGITYYRERENSIVRYATDFDNVLLNLDSDILYKKGTLKKLAENYLIIYLHIPCQKVKRIAEHEEYSCYKEKSMYCLTKEQFDTRIENATAVADLVVNVTSSSYFQASKDVVRAIMRHYGLST